MYAETNELVGKKIVVTGGAGFIGSAIANILSERNLVIAIDDCSSGNWGRCNEEVIRIQNNLCSISEFELDSILENADFVFHTAAIKLNSDLANFSSIMDNNIVATQKLVEAATRNRVKRFVFTSSLYAYGNLGPEIMHESDAIDVRTLYGTSKYFGEHLIRLQALSDQNFSYVIARLFFVYGPNQFSEGGYKSIIAKNFQRLKLGLPAIIYGSGNQTLDYIYIDDCIKDLISLAMSEFQGTINVSNGIGITINQLTKHMCEIATNNNVIYERSDWTDGTIRVGSNLKLDELLGKRQRTSIISGLERTWEQIV